MFQSGFRLKPCYSTACTLTLLYYSHSESAWSWEVLWWGGWRFCGMSAFIQKTAYQPVVNGTWQYAKWEFYTLVWDSSKFVSTPWRWIKMTHRIWCWKFKGRKCMTFWDRKNCREKLTVTRDWGGEGGSDE